jgi:hypothetical protein
MNPLFWNKLSIHEDISKNHTGGSVTYIPSRRTFLYIGAPLAASPAEAKPFSFKKGEDKAALLAQVFEYDPEPGEWRAIPTTGRVPTQRNFHGALFEAGHLILYGGQERKVTGDLLALNVHDFTWKKLFCLERPPLRLHSAFIRVGALLMLVGGASMPENLHSNEIWCLSL